MDVWLSDRRPREDGARPRRDRSRSPIPTQVVSNGEYMPWPQTPAQRRVEHEIAHARRRAAAGASAWIAGSSCAPLRDGRRVPRHEPRLRRRSSP